MNIMMKIYALNFYVQLIIGHSVICAMKHCAKEIWNLPDVSGVYELL